MTWVPLSDLPGEPADEPTAAAGVRVGEFRAQDYPGRRPSGPTLVYSGERFPVRVDGDGARPCSLDGPASGAPVLTTSLRRWTVAYGANASPERLVAKGLDLDGALILPAFVFGWVRAWESRRTVSTGAIPLTLVRRPGNPLDVHVVGVTLEAAARLDASEVRGDDYVLGRVGPVPVADRFVLSDAVAYGPGPDTRVLAPDAEVLTWPSTDHATASASFDSEAMSFGADPLPRPITDGWPDTPLADLPLFVYGTLMPGERNHHVVSDHVDVGPEASTSGDLVDTFHGWPAARFGATRTIHGRLLHVKPGHGRALYSATDLLEDAPRMFRRHTILVRDVDGGARWAVGYAWNPRQGPRPGTPNHDGRWVQQI